MPAAKETPPRTASASTAARERCTLGDRCAVRLKCDLARQCLPMDNPEPHLKFAWANAICLLFIAIGISGLSEPLIVFPTHAAMKKADIVPVLFNPPPPSAAPAAQPASSDESPTDQPQPDDYTPEVVPAVAPDTAQVAFAVPVEGPVRVVPAQYAPVPPAKLKPAPAPKGNSGSGSGSNQNNNTGTRSAVEFHGTEGDGGTYPPPTYPALALRRGYQGKVMLEATIDINGNPVQLLVRDSSGREILDEHALNWVKQKWRWPAGPERHYLIPFIFKIK